MTQGATPNEVTPTWERLRAELDAREYERLTADELDQLADAAFWTDDHARAVDVRRDAYRAHAHGGDAARAAMAAWNLFYDHHLVGELAPAAGWLERCRHHVAASDDEVAAGWLAVAEADVALDGSSSDARQHASTAKAIGIRAGDADLTAMALQAEGRALIAGGDHTTGLSRLDEAMIAVINDELQPMYTGWVYCNVVATCHAIADVRRATEWSDAAMRWCATLREGVLYPGLCRVYAVELAYLRGDWERAISEAERACDQLVSFEPRYAGAAFGLVGDLRRLRGDLDGAEGAYRRAHDLGSTPQPGLGLLRRARGDRRGAVRSLRSALNAGPDGPLPRAFLLGALADVATEVGDDATALDALAELTAMADGAGGLLDAIAAGAQAEIDRCAGRVDDAIAGLRRAIALLDELRFPYEAARRRVRLAELARATGDRTTAALELQAAVETFAQLGATLDLDRATRLRDGAGIDSCPLSAREREVLGLVASGHTNSDIAAELVVSPHTVARHMTNIRTKLGVHSRAAAVAAATARDWL